jgi:hypothetical protein
MRGSGNLLEGSEMRISASENEPLKFTSGGRIETLARRGNVVPAWTCCAVKSEILFGDREQDVI